MKRTQTPRQSTKLALSGSKRVAKTQFHFTKKAIDALPLPDGPQRVYYRDSAVRGLTVAVAASGRKTFVLYRKVNGKPERISIGLYPDLSIEQARGKAEELNGAIASGRNPATEKRKIRAENSLGELFDTFLELYAKERKRTWREDVAAFNRYLGHWRYRKISTISRADVLALHARLGRDRGKITANRTIELLSALYNRAINDYGFEGTNPADRVKAFREKKRSRFLQAHELPAFFQALREEPNSLIRDFVIVALLTGARRSNVQSMEWSEIDWHRGVWSIPAHKAKADEAIDIPLIGAVTDVLRRRQASSLSEYVFPGTGKNGHLEEPKKAWRRIVKRAGCEDLRLHDLRRTFGSWQAALGTSLQIIGKSLGHQSLEATAIYARLQLDPVRESVEKAGAAMLLAGSVLPGERP